MTSSLVGSEMCIRDRYITLGGGLLVKMRGGRRLVDVLQVLQPKSADPVSYTHLTLPTICSV
eukprot:12749617-Prorocentrum_lima.AAC.1